MNTETFMALLQEMADADAGWEDGDGNPIAEDAASFLRELAALRARIAELEEQVEELKCELWDYAESAD